MGQTDIVIHDHEEAIARVHDVEARADGMDEYLDYYAQRLEMIDRQDNHALNKSQQRQVSVFSYILFVFILVISETFLHDHLHAVFKH